MNPGIWQTAALSSTLALLLVACSNQDATPVSSETVPTAQETPTPVSMAQETPRIEIPFDHVILNQSGVFAGEGAGSGGDSTLTAEFLSGTAEEVSESLTASLRAQGFRLSNSEPARGGERRTFRRGDSELLSVLIRPRGEVTLVTDGAEGSIFISWRSN